jgi:ubiquinone/menaquinone biosynthesis C-methylase UbiE
VTHFNNLANEWDSPEKVKLMHGLAINATKSLNLKPGLKIMDFGCGTGLFGLEFLEFASELVGVDTSEGMLKVMQQKTSNLHHVRTININLENEELDEKFDLIISSMAFHHLEDPAKMISKMHTMLTEKGRLVIVDLDKEDGTFHPDNEGMGVKHFGFSKDELLKWAKDYSDTHHEIIYKVEKNEQVYPQFMLVLTR